VPFVIKIIFLLAN